MGSLNGRPLAKYDDLKKVAGLLWTKDSRKKAGGG